jgi:ribonuclease E
MPNKMLIDATHPEETRVVVLRGQRVEEFDFESASRKQLRGNIYLAKVTRVEPSLQAAFVDYGGNRHGFLAFSEIHPDYYQIPVADRQALIAEDERAQRAADAEADHRVVRRQRRSDLPRDEIKSEPVEAEAESEVESRLDAESDTAAMAACSEQMAPEADLAESMVTDAPAGAEVAIETTVTEEREGAAPSPATTKIPIELAQLESSSAAEPIPSESTEGPRGVSHVEGGDDIAAPAERADAETSEIHPIAAAANITEVNGTEGEEEAVESVGGADAMEEVPERMPRLRRQYKIQEVIKRRQVMLVQVVKEERGTKGAALTTYLSLAGRYSVLMPNTARGGGISRKITSADDRRRLKEIAQELEVPEGMGVILRTAGASRTKTEVKRDFEYLLRLWETVRDLTLKSTAPKLVYEEGSLVKRSIRDLYNKDIDEILVAGDAAYQEAKEFMRMLMPSHAKNVKLYRDGLPIFTRHGIESQLDAMFTPVMQLRSGGYIVLNQAEALVAIDVNSGRATREHHIEDTALKTNLEAAEEIARQLRLRDLAGLIVIDFIDMDEKRNNRAVERRLKECLRHDRARIQVGHISHFGLLEMSRQRIRSSVLESSTEKCPHCGGTGHVRSVSSVALQLLRSLEEMLLKGATHNLTVRTRSEIALYLLNHKRAHLRALEERFRITIVVNADSSIGGQVTFLIERGEQVHSLEQAKVLAAQAPATAPIDRDDEESFEDEDEAPEFEDVAAPTSDEEVIELGEQSQHRDEDQGQEEGQEQGQGRKRRRRRRGRRGGEGRDDGAFQRQPSATPTSPEQPAHVAAGEHDAGGDFVELPAADALGAASAEIAAESNGEGEQRRRRRGRRGGRRNRRDREGEAAALETDVLEPELARAASDLDAVPDLVDAPAPMTDMQSPPAITERQADAPANAEARAQDKAPVQTAEPSLSATTTSEPARRRSTVREPPLTSLRDEAAEPAPSLTSSPASAEPVVSSSVESENGDRPRRSGWWSKRVLGRH